MNRSMDTTVEKDELPEPIIKHILSFLTAKQAARTTLLSSSCRKAWLTQPNLAFEIEDDFFRELARKTVLRYEESNLRIQSLTLCEDFRLHNAHSCNELIAKSFKLGATHLNLSLSRNFVLPHDIVFGSEKLVELSVEGCKIEIGSSDRKVIRCSGLESLSLDFTDISLDELSNIISSCPSIRKLSLSFIWWRVGVDGGLGLLNLLCLTRLELVNLKFDTLFLGDMSSRFPNLKDLILHIHPNFSQGKEIQISSCSLERLNFAQGKDDLREKRVRYRFDVPSIRRFTYEGRSVPALSFKSTSREWESRAKIECRKNPNRLWFRRLNDFLTKLRRSKISHLSLKVKCAKSLNYVAREIEGLHRKRPVVENLTVNVKELPYLSCYALFDGLFQICRTTFITQYLHPFFCSEYFLCKAFLARQGGNERHLLYDGLRDLEEVNAEVFDKEVSVWRHVPLNSLLDDASMTVERKKIRFHLEWKSKPHGDDL